MCAGIAVFDAEEIRDRLKHYNLKKDTLDEAYEEIRSCPEKVLSEDYFGIYSKRLRKGFQKYLEEKRKSR